MTEAEYPSTAWTLNSGALSLELSATDGSMWRLQTDDGWDVLDQRRLGATFQILLPLKERRYNYVRASDCTPTRCEVSEGGTLVTTYWDSVHSEHGGEHDMSVTTTVRQEKDRLVFGITIDNRSDLFVENVYYPELAGVQPPKSGALEAFSYYYSSARRSQLWPRFDNQIGYWGSRHPTYFYDASLGCFGAPAVPFVLLQDGARGIYVGIDEPRADIVAWFAELVPGYQDSLTRRPAANPAIAGRDSYMRFAAVHVPFVRPGERRDLTPIALAAFTGDWHAGADRFVARRQEWGVERVMGPDWTENPHSWIQVQMNNPEDERRYRFEDLPAIARECAENGVKAIQLVGWNIGGQDKNNPSHLADPVLGGEEALRSAITQCHKHGVLVILFTKFTWADRNHADFAEKYLYDTVKDPLGDYYLNKDYPYSTVSQYLQINTRKLIPMCFGSQHWVETCKEEFARVLSYGAAGMLFDEAMHHTPAVLCFDPDHGHEVPDFVYGHDLDFARQLREVCGSQHRDFLFAAEAAYDLMFDTYQVSYHRSDGGATSPFFAGQHVPVTRYLRPDATLISVVTGFHDRNMINQCLRYRYVISYEPFNFSGMLSDFPDTVRYGNAIDTQRTRFRKWFWDGTFRDDQDAYVITDGGEPHADYSVFRASDGSKGVVVVNNSDDAVDGLSLSAADGDLSKHIVIDAESGQAVGDGSSFYVAARSAVLAVPTVPES